VRNNIFFLVLEKLNPVNPVKIKIMLVPVPHCIQKLGQYNKGGEAKGQVRQGNQRENRVFEKPPEYDVK
jgi:hypothetical protein